MGETKGSLPRSTGFWPDMTGISLYTKIAGRIKGLFPHGVNSTGKISGPPAFKHPALL